MLLIRNISNVSVIIEDNEIKPSETKKLDIEYNSYIESLEKSHMIVTSSISEEESKAPVKINRRTRKNNLNESE